MRSLAALFFLMISLSCANAATFETGTISGWPAVRISGPIVVGDNRTFEGLISPDQKNLIVELNSPGGAVFPAIAIGRLIRDRGNWTLVARGESCASACAMIWLGGKVRYTHPNGSVGFHAVFDGDTKQITGNGNAVVGAYYDHLGLSQDAIFWMASAPPNGMFWLNHDIEKKYNITFAVAKEDDHIVDPVIASDGGGGIPQNPNAPSVAYVPPQNNPDPPPTYAPPHVAQPVILNPDQDLAAVRLARQFEKRMSEAGPAGLVDSIRACYGAVRRSNDGRAAEYCAGLDEMAWKLDSTNGQENGTQTSPFSREENVRVRIKEIGAQIGYDPDQLLDVSTEMAKRAQFIMEAGHQRVAEAVPPQVVYRRPRVVRSHRVAGCNPIGLAALNPAAAMLFGVTPNPACQ